MAWDLLYELLGQTIFKDFNIFLEKKIDEKAPKWDVSGAKIDLKSIENLLNIVFGQPNGIQNRCLPSYWQYFSDLGKIWV